MKEILGRGRASLADRGLVQTSASSRRTLEDRRHRRESTYVLLVLRPDDARAASWSFYEGIKGIVLPP